MATIPHGSENPSADILNRLAARFPVTTAVVLRTLGEPGKVQKIVVGLHDSSAIETVIIPAGTRHTVCVSTQVGCRRHCSFCASGQHGWVRNLTAAEIVDQVLLAAHHIGRRPTNVVYMGVGEPFDNYDAVMESIPAITNDHGLAVGIRKITISTSGVIPGIERLAREPLHPELSVSLHATRDAVRDRLMPINRAYPIPDLIRACRVYTETTRRVVIFEYTLIREVNDSLQEARELVSMLGAFPCRVNFLTLNPIPEYAESPSTRETAGMFMDLLAQNHITAMLRESRGDALGAACGQLRVATTRAG